MDKLRALFQYLNPIAHLGEKQYSFVVPFYFMVPLSALLEIYAHQIAQDPNSVGMVAIVLYIALIIFFAFRFGIKGGLAAALITIGYYFYVIYSRGYAGAQLWSSINLTLWLGLLYAFLAMTVGWLKQTIDRLLVMEINAKHQLQTIIKNLPVGIKIVDSEGLITMTNDKTSEITGRKIRPGVSIKADGVVLLHPKSKKLMAENEHPAMVANRADKSIFNKEFLVEKPLGELQSVLISAAPLKDKDGINTGAVSIMQDITEIRELEKRKDDFINIASHELKTPVTSLVLFLGILKQTLKKKEIASAEKTVGKIENQLNNLQELIRSLLDVSRIQTGKLVLNKEKTRLDELIAEVITALKHHNGKQKIIFSYKRKAEVMIDKYRIGQVLTNLITNAMKYSEGKGDIIVRLKRNQTNKYEISVKDHGIGIKQDQQKKIFEKLYQVNEDKAGTFPGFGMGLYIAREIITQHRGQIWVDSSLGKGATFYFTLPA